MKQTSRSDQRRYYRCVLGPGSHSRFVRVLADYMHVLILVCATALLAACWILTRHDELWQAKHRRKAGRVVR